MLEARPLPPGVPNLMTAAGHARLREAVAALRARTTATSGPESARLQALTRRLDSAVVVARPEVAPTAVAFGCCVTVAQDSEKGRVTRRLTIVGVDEVDEAKGEVSWLGPVAQALLGAQVGDVVTVETPRGEVELEVLALEA